MASANLDLDAILAFTIKLALDVSVLYHTSLTLIRADMRSGRRDDPERPGRALRFRSSSGEGEAELGRRECASLIMDSSPSPLTDIDVIRSS